MKQPDHIIRFNAAVAHISSTLYSSFPIPRPLRADDYYGPDIVARIRVALADSDSPMIEHILSRDHRDVKTLILSLETHIRSFAADKEDLVDILSKLAEDQQSSNPSLEAFMGAKANVSAQSGQLEALQPIEADWAQYQEIFYATLDFLVRERYVAEVEDDCFCFTDKGITAMFSRPSGLDGRTLIDRVRDALAVRSADDLLAVSTAIFNVGNLMFRSV